MMKVTQDMKCHLFLLFVANTYNVVNTSQDKHTAAGPGIDHNKYTSINTGI